MPATMVPELWGTPAVRHEGACASGSLATLAAMAELEAGRYDCALVIGAEIELVQEKDRERKLERLIKEVEQDYDFIFIDCPPSLGLLTINSLTAAHSVLIPLQCEYYALEGLSQLLKTIHLIKQALNPKLTVEGILLTMFDSRNNLSHQVAQEVKTYFKGKVFQTIIPRNIRLSEAPSHGKPALLYDIHSKGAESYLNLAKEILTDGKINGN